MLSGVCLIIFRNVFSYGSFSLFMACYIEKKPRFSFSIHLPAKPRVQASSISTFSFFSKYNKCFCHLTYLVDGESCSERYNPDIVEEENHQNNIPEKFIMITGHKLGRHNYICADNKGNYNIIFY